MPIATIKEMYTPILNFLSVYGASSLPTIRNAMTDYFYIPRDIAFEKDEDSEYSLFETRVNAACYALVRANLITRTNRGVYELSALGCEAVESYDYVDSDYLKELLNRSWFIGKDNDAETEKKRRNLHIIHTYWHVDEDGARGRIYGTHRRDFFKIEKPSLEDLAELKIGDTRFANMIASGGFLLEENTIKEVPSEVRMHDQTYQEFKATTLMHSADNNAILCYGEAVTGKTISAPQPGIDGYHKGPKPPVVWTNPIKWISDTSNRAYYDVKGILDYFRNNRNFNQCFEHLIKDVYKITEKELERKSGVHQKKIQRMMNDPNTPVKAGELTAILWVLQVHAYVVDELFDLAGLSPRSPKYAKYTLICTLTIHLTYQEVNALCVQEGIPEIFDKNLQGTP